MTKVLSDISPQGFPNTFADPRTANLTELSHLSPFCWLQSLQNTSKDLLKARKKSVFIHFILLCKYLTMQVKGSASSSGKHLWIRTSQNAENPDTSWRKMPVIICQLKCWAFQEIFFSPWIKATHKHLKTICFGRLSCLFCKQVGVLSGCFKNRHCKKSKY